MFKKSIILFSLVIISIVITSCTTTSRMTTGTTVTPAITSCQPVTMFSGAPRYSDLDQSIRNSTLFNNAPKPHVSLLNYQSYQTSNHNKYSNYQIRLYKTKEKLTEYRTTEITGANNRLHGFGIGYGGIISIAYMKRGNLARHHHYYIHYQWTKMSDVQGHLFPLKVGNRLSFHYQDLVRTQPGQTPRANNGIIVYQVTGKMKGYNSGLTVVPGEVYVIKFSKTTRQHPRLETQNIYYFSQRLGWYVFAKYFFNNKEQAEYRLASYSRHAPK